MALMGSGAAMGELAMLAHERFIEIGGMPILVRTDSPEFFEHACASATPVSSTHGPRGPLFTFDVEIVPPAKITDEEDLSVGLRARGGPLDHRARRLSRRMEPGARRGWVRQSANPYAIDAVLRILHSLILAGEGGF